MQKTAAAQNMVAVGFVETQFQTTITWTEWFIAGAAFAAPLSLPFIITRMTRMMKLELEEIVGGKATTRDQLAAVEPMTLREWKQLLLVLALLGFWSTEKVLHNFDASSPTVAAIGLMLLPRIGV